MARGGYRPGAGRPKGSGKAKSKGEKKVRAAETTLQSADATPRQYKTALDFAMAVINSPDANMDAKIRLAVAALPFQHPKLEGAAPGKKEQREEAAKQAAGGKYAPPSPPKLVVSNP